MKWGIFTVHWLLCFFLLWNVCSYFWPFFSLQLCFLLNYRHYSLHPNYSSVFTCYKYLPSNYGQFFIVKKVLILKHQLYHFFHCGQGFGVLFKGILSSKTCKDILHYILLYGFLFFLWKKNPNWSGIDVSDTWFRFSHLDNQCASASF